MTNKSLIKSKEYPYYVTARIHISEWYYLPEEPIWRIFCELTTCLIERYGVQVHALVLVPERFYLILTTPRGNLREALSWFLGEMSRSIKRYVKSMKNVLG